MSATTLLTSFGTGHGLHGLVEQVLQLECLHEVRVPHQGAISGLDTFHAVEDLTHLAHTLLESLLITEHSTVLLHGALHVVTNDVCRKITICEPQLIQVGDRSSTSILGQWLLCLTGLCEFFDAVCTCTTKHNDIQQRVCSQTIGTVNRDRCALTGGEKTRNNLRLVITFNCDHLTHVVGRNTAHVVVNRRQNRDRLLGHIDTSKDLCGFRNAGQTFGQDLWAQMREL
mmetsp:Transcript_24577/g.61654  ORF Transcript_24577/g.61654 Transcript_24577/m.61654 type:complete len:228 (+) Transcript_24577:205-888(+)